MCSISRSRGRAKSARKVLGTGEEPVLYFITGYIPDKGDSVISRTRAKILVSGKERKLLGTRRETARHRRKVEEIEVYDCTAKSPTFLVYFNIRHVTCPKAAYSPSGTNLGEQSWLWRLVKRLVVCIV